MRRVIRTWAWAKAQGYKVNERGRVPADIVAKYEAANGRCVADRRGDGTQHGVGGGEAGGGAEQVVQARGMGAFGKN